MKFLKGLPLLQFLFQLVVKGIINTPFPHSDLNFYFLININNQFNNLINIHIINLIKFNLNKIFNKIFNMKIFQNYNKHNFNLNIQNFDL
ncbi:hypothetical protein BCR36DRAFT_583353 [Piromyces finnis]|uniref:Uncharacterized protein n=1 Tax=Piromyces finnis TaxID=1754191 RepID=A0A1Y1VA95_9FUNG|nr:hypothetical protein BCR36DRAFT_583353 [Piromyces finnis]|eukprot:ORX50774.1 hypothetical protein BCR36DRAFT_583353 [Piromyces finnis]